jgi:hypothetical protein
MLKIPSKNPENKVIKNTNQQDINDPHKILKLGEEESDQTNTRLAKYGQNSERTSD